MRDAPFASYLVHELVLLKLGNHLPRRSLASAGMVLVVAATVAVAL